jgi:hypothetical protein
MTIAAPQALIEQAESRTGLTDFGPEGWREGFERLVAVMSERDFGETARARIEGRFVDVLARRLRIEDWIARHPEVLDQRIERPVFILGLPRTATTALQAFLANDPQWRYLRGWEAQEPVPPPDIATEAADRRLLAERAKQHGDGQLAQSLHIAEADGPVDDADVLRLDFRNQELGWPAWAYTRWWRDCDMTTAYAYHARLLKLLQSRRPPHRWLVKAPWHNFHIEALARQYPDAVFVMCHRDPAKIVPSVASLLGAVHRGFLGADATAREDVGAFVLEHLSISVRRVLDFRARHGDARFIDVRHGEFNADPFGTAERLYRWLGLELGAGARADMEAWAERNRRGAHGEHSYTAEEFGLDAGRIREAFAGYVEAFGL